MNSISQQGRVLGGVGSKISRDGSVASSITSSSHHMKTPREDSMTLVAAAAVQETMATVAGAGVSASLPAPTTLPDRLGMSAAEQLSARALSAIGEVHSGGSFQGKAQLQQQMLQEAQSAAITDQVQESVPAQQDEVMQQEEEQEQDVVVEEPPVKDRVWPRPRPTVEDDIAGESRHEVGVEPVQDLGGSQLKFGLAYPGVGWAPAHLDGDLPYLCTEVSPMHPHMYASSCSSCTSKADGGGGTRA
jgi:hypothetical protein